VLKKGRERVESILDAATAILIGDGYAGLTTRKVATRAGVRLGHLQYYFPTKQAVVRALLERYLERASHSVAKRIAAAATPESRLDAALDAILAEQRNGDACRFFWELWALAARDPAIADAMQKFYRAYWRSVVGALLDVAPNLGRPRAERRAALLIAMLEGLSLFRSRGEHRELPLPFLERELRSLTRKLATDLD
jgi:AcrR family transcriptional regulator